MKTAIRILRNFIKDFQLEVNGIVCFEARLEFSCDAFCKKLDSEIHMITIEFTGLSVFYLLNPELAKFGIPDYFPYQENNFVYSKRKSLEIKGSNDAYEFYTMRIFPIAVKGQLSCLYNEAAVFSHETR